MHIEITSQGFPMTSALRTYASRRLQPSLGLARDCARRVRVILSDQNGPRGGLDKRCRIAISVAGAPTLVIDDVQADMYSAIDRASGRALRTLARRLSRRRSHRGAATAREPSAEEASSAEE